MPPKRQPKSKLEVKYSAEETKEIVANMSSDCAEDFSLTGASTVCSQPGGQNNQTKSVETSVKSESVEGVRINANNEIPLSTLEDGEILDWYSEKDSNASSDILKLARTCKVFVYMLMGQVLNCE